MKIIIGSESFPPNMSGVAVFAERTACFLAKQGHEVYVFASSRKFDTEEIYDPRGFTVVRLRSVPNPFRKNFYVAFFPSAEIRRRLDKIKPDVIHIQDPTSICGSLLKAAGKRNIPVIATNHFSMFFILAYLGWMKPLYPIVEKVVSWFLCRFYNKCTTLTTPSAVARGSLIKMGVQTEIRVISNGVDLTRFKPVANATEAREHFGLPNKPVIVYVGRIDKDKSIDVLILAMKEVIKRTDTHLFIVGGGDEYDAIEEMVSGLGLLEHVTMHSRIDNATDEFPLAYQAGSLFAIPSLIETQSIVTLEALATGLPLVAADATCMPEFISHHTGYLFKPNDYHDMAKKIVKILEDKDLQQEMSRNARSYTEDHSIDKTNLHFEQLYEEVIKSNK